MHHVPLEFGSRARHSDWMVAGGVAMEHVLHKLYELHLPSLFRISKQSLSAESSRA